MACDITYKGKTYSLSEFTDLLAEKELANLIKDGVLTGDLAKDFADISGIKIEPKAEATPDDMIAEGIDILANFLGAKKNFTAEEKPNIIKAVRLIAEGLAKKLGIKGKELYQALKDELNKSGYKDVADNLDSIKDEIRDDFRDVEPPKGETAEAETAQGKVRAISKRSAKEYDIKGDVERANSILNREASTYQADSWKETDPKANEAVDILLQGDTKTIENRVKDFLFDPKSIVNIDTILQDTGGGTMAAFILLKLRDRLETMGMSELSDTVTDKLAETATKFGQYISALQRRAIAEGLVGMEVRKAQQQAEEAMSNTFVDELNSLKDIIAELKKKLEVTESEMQKVIDAKVVADAARIAAEKAAAKKKAKTKQVTLEAEAPKEDDTVKLKKRRVIITGKMRERNKEIKNLLKQIVSSDTPLGFAMLPENDPVAKLIKLLREQAIDFVRLGITDLNIVRNNMTDSINALAAKTKVTADEIWNNVVSEDFDALSEKAQSEYLADKLETALVNILDGKTSKTNQGKVLDAIATVLVNRVSDKKAPKDKDAQLKRAVEVIKNRELALDAAKAALTRVRVMLDGMNMTDDQKQEAYQKAEDIINAMTQDTLPDAVLRREVGKGLKTLEASMRDIALAHFTQQDKAKEVVTRTLVDKLMALGLDADSANQYASAVEAEFNKQLGEKRAKIVQDVMNKDLPTKAANLADNLDKLYRTRNVGKIIEYLDKIGFPPLTQKQLDDIEAATSKEEAKAVFDGYSKQENVQRKLTSDVSAKLQERINKAVSELQSKLGGVADKVFLVNKILKANGGNQLTDGEITDINMGMLDDDGIIQLVKEKIRTKALMGALGRTLTGEKRTQAKKKSVTQKLVELAQMGVFDDQTAAEIFSENYGIPRLTQQDIDILNTYISNMVSFSGEISKLYEQKIKNYLEKIKLTSANSDIVYRANTLFRGIKAAFTRFMLSGLMTNFVSIPIGTVWGYVTNGLPAYLSLVATKPDIAKTIFDIYEKNKIKGISVNDFANVMRGSGISQLQSDFTGEYTDKQSVNGNIVSYYEDLPFKKMSRMQKMVRMTVYPMLGALRMARFSQAFDLLFTHPVGELLNIWDELDAQNAALSQIDGVESPLVETLRNNAKRQQLIQIVEQKLGYTDRILAEQEADAEIELMQDRGVEVPRGLRQRLIKTNMMKRRNQERMEKAYEKAKRMGYMDMPKKGSFEKRIFEWINSITSIDDKADINRSTTAASKASTIAINAGKTLLSMTMFTFARIGLMLGKASLQGVPLVPTVYYAIKRTQAKESMEQIMTGSKALTNLVLTGGMIAAFLANFEILDEDEEEDEERPSFTMFGIRMRQVENPSIKFYGESPLKSYGEQERMRITAGGKSITYPEWSIQFGDGAPKSIRFIPPLYIMTSILSKMQEPARMKKYEKVYGKLIEKEVSASEYDLGVAVFETLLANSFAIGAENSKDIFNGIGAMYRTLTEDKIKLEEGQKEPFNMKKFEDEKNIEKFIGVFTDVGKSLLTPNLMRDVSTYAQNFAGVQEEAKTTTLDRMFSDNLYYEAILNPLIFKRKDKAYDAFGLPYKEKVNADEIIRTLTLDAVNPDDDFEKETRAKSQSPLFKLMTDKKVVYPYYGAYDSDVTPEMVGKKPEQKVTKDDVRLVDQYTRLQISKSIAYNYDELKELEGFEMYQKIKNISDREKKRVLRDLTFESYTEDKLRQLIEADIKEVADYEKKLK